MWKNNLLFCSDDDDDDDVLRMPNRQELDLPRPTCSRRKFGSELHRLYPGKSIASCSPCASCDGIFSPPDTMSVRRSVTGSVTRLGDLLDFGLILKPLATIILPKSPTFLCIFYKSLIFLAKSFLGNFYRHLATFYWSHW